MCSTEQIKEVSIGKLMTHRNKKKPVFFMNDISQDGGTVY